MSVLIRKANVEDIDSIVKIHETAFEGFFLTSLGRNFLNLYYKSFILSNHGVVLCAEKDNNLVGFSACSYESRGFNSRLIKKNLIRFGLEAVLLLFTRPGALIRLIKNINKESNDANIDDNGLYAELYSIAVDPSCQGEGVGRLLLTATETDVKEYTNKVSLTTDYCNNDNTIAFYHALGYEDYYSFVAYPDRKMWRLIKEL